MPRIPFQTNIAPTGYDSNSDRTALPRNRARRLQNVVCDHNGQTRASFEQSVVHTFPAGIDGTAIFYGSNPDDDRLLVVSDTQLWAARPGSSPQSNPPTWINWQPVGSGFQRGKQARAASYRFETIFVQECGIQPLRFDGTALYQLGISPPSSAPLAFPGTPSNSATGLKKGIITYKQSHFDSRFRESELSAGAPIDFTAAANVGKDAYLTANFGTDPQIFGNYLYANTSGGSIYYRIATLLKSAGQTMYEDNAADNSVNVGTPGPGVGQFSIPHPASCICTLKQHVFLNNTNAPSELQYNNLDQPTQWARVTRVATDGGILEAATDQGDPICALVPFGSLLGIWKRRNFYQLWGDTATDFVMRPLHERGTIAPGSPQRADNVLFSLMDNGVYQMNYDTGFLNNKVSLEIDSDIEAHNRADQENAAGAFCGSRYYLGIGDTMFFYDLTTGGWASWKRSAGV